MTDDRWMRAHGALIRGLGGQGIGTRGCTVLCGGMERCSVVLVRHAVVHHGDHADVLMADGITLPPPPNTHTHMELTPACPPTQAHALPCPPPPPSPHTPACAPLRPWAPLRQRGTWSGVTCWA